ncbi:dehydrogenase [Nonlabens sp. YIK11]|uniref:2-hydroxyacid dehydrogenase n=1 Tax=Nonlabens sp. YIK11 TaxID=1453349 RepID=UPI0006DC84CD|nr:glyoxylate/hydroxypyruvate reductase A [Nonlabens sp. YIK11]KQC33148.1 dehydrogenase [Nonlabens sp. YIK11]
MAILLIRNDKDYQPWIDAFQEYDASLEVVTLEMDHDPDAVTMAMMWKAPEGSFKGYDHLQVIGSLGAGVDHLFADPSLPENVQLTRVVDEKLSGDMQEFVLGLCLNHIKNLHFYAQQDREWKPQPYLRVENVHVGILGFGTLGQAVGAKLKSVGFQVSGWSKTAKNVDGIKSYRETELDDFLNVSQILVCLLPLTEKTTGILNKELFMQLPENAFLINVARGGHLVETDLLESIENGHLAGAALDVFNKEPLPQDHAFWKHPKVLITPHVASNSNPPTVVAQIVENYRRMKNGDPLKNTVSSERGY